jgi:hypothetical protein
LPIAWHWPESRAKNHRPGREYLKPGRWCVSRQVTVAGGLQTQFARIVLRDNGALRYLLTDHDLATQDSGSTSVVADAAGNKLSEMR